MARRGTRDSIRDVIGHIEMKIGDRCVVFLPYLSFFVGILEHAMTKGQFLARHFGNSVLGTGRAHVVLDQIQVALFFQFCAYGIVIVDREAIEAVFVVQLFGIGERLDANVATLTKN